MKLPNGIRTRLPKKLKKALSKYLQEIQLGSETGSTKIELLDIAVAYLEGFSDGTAKSKSLVEILEYECADDLSPCVRQVINLWKEQV